MQPEILLSIIYSTNAKVFRDIPLFRVFVLPSSYNRATHSLRSDIWAVEGVKMSILLIREDLSMRPLLQVTQHIKVLQASDAATIAPDNDCVNEKSFQLPKDGVNLSPPYIKWILLFRVSSELVNRVCSSPNALGKPPSPLFLLPLIP